MQEEVDVQKVVRVMLVEDQADFRRLIISLLSREPELEVVAEAGSLAEARRRAVSTNFDVAITDLGLPDGNGADLVRDLREANPDAAVLILSASLDPMNLARAKEAAADGIFDKFGPPDEIISAIRRLKER